MIRRPDKRNALSLLELVVSLTVVGIFAGILLLSIHKAAIYAKEVILIMELKNMRLSLGLYKALKGDYPPDLKILVETRHKFDNSQEFVFGEKFIQTLKKDNQGYPVDAFKNRYYYNSRKGVINSVTKGYENW